MAVVLKGWPRLSETFIAQEIAGLEARGLELGLWSLRQPTDTLRHPVHDRVRAAVTYLPEYLKDDPARVFAAWLRARRLPGYAQARAAYRRDLAADRTANRRRRWGQALVLAAEMPDSIETIYAHFIHTPASVGRYAALMRGLPWTVSAHAKDIWTTPDIDLAAKLADCRALTTCTRRGFDRLRALAPKGARLELIYHGLDFAHLPPPPPPRAARDGSDPADPIRILSVGRRVAKKGFEDILDALALLPVGLHWRFDHIGAGPLGDALRAHTERLGIAARCVWHGAQAQAAVFAAYARADVFVLASKIAADGDVDGLPNVLMEAAHQGLALVATDAAAIGEFIADGREGLLVPPADPPALARALQRAATDPALRGRLGAQAGATLRARFSFDTGVDRIADLVRPSMPLSRAAE